MTCTTDVAIVELTSDGEQITVSSGFQGATPSQPQTTPVKESNIIPWNGFGRHQWSYLDFTFANQTFSLSSSFDTAYPNSKWETFLSIGDDIHTCVEKYNRDPFDDFIALKFDAGQCWSLEHQAWSFNCY